MSMADINVVATRAIQATVPVVLVRIRNSTDFNDNVLMSGISRNINKKTVQIYLKIALSETCSQFTRLFFYTYEKNINLVDNYLIVFAEILDTKIYCHFYHV